VALVDGHDRQTRELLDQIAAEGFEIDVERSLDRDVSDDAAVGAFIALVDGDRREHARRLVQTIRAIGFRMPLWALADSHRVADVAVLGLNGRSRGIHLFSASQSPGLLREAGRRERDQVRHEPAAAVFGGLMAYDAGANVAFACPGISADSLPEVARGSAVSSNISASGSSATICVATPTWISAIC